MSWVSTLSGQSYTRAVSGVAGAVASAGDPELAASIVGQLPEAERGQLIQRISLVISNRDPQSALNWLGRFRNDPAYDAAAATIAAHLAHRDPHYALRIADGLGTEHRLQATQNILGNWTRMDPFAASRWAAGSSVDQRAQAVGAVSQVWASMDTASASRWVRSLRTGAAKDQGLITLSANAGFDTHETSDLVNVIGSESAREQAIVGAYYRLRRQYDDTAAAEFLDRVDASENLRGQLNPQPGGH